LCKGANKIFMKGSPFRSALFLASLAASFFLLDIVYDFLIGDTHAVSPSHFIFAIAVILLSAYYGYQLATSREREEIIVRQSRAELEGKVQERTAELERANQDLQTEITMHRQAKELQERLLAQVDQGRQRAEALAAELQLANTTLNTLIDTLPAGLMIVNKNGELERANFLAKFILKELLLAQGNPESPSGASARTVGSPLLCYSDGTGIRQQDLPLERALEFGQVTPGLEAKLCPEEGKSLYVLISASPVYDESGQIISAVQVIQDITPIKTAGQALQASEEKFSTVFRLSPDSQALLRLEDQAVLDVNDKFLQMFDLEREQVVGKSWRNLPILPGRAEQDRIQATFKRYGFVTDFEVDLSSLLDRVQAVLISLIPIPIQGQDCVLAIAHDVSARKRSEMALAQAQTELARELQERAALEERQRLARDLHDSVSQDLYGISLGAHTALALFESDQVRTLEALNYILSLAQAALSEMRALIFELRPQSLEIEGLTGALIKRITALRLRHPVEIELELCPEPEVALKTKEALYWIAQEALQNAVKHAQAAHLNVRLAEDPHCLVLEICDSGQGFDPLAAYPGHLGLRSMRERAQSVGGELEIISQPDCGTQVHVHVPIYS
jgi:PAS domain S-box-containing protein